MSFLGLLYASKGSKLLLIFCPGNAMMDGVTMEIFMSRLAFTFVFQLVLLYCLKKEKCLYSTLWATPLYFAHSTQAGKSKFLWTEFAWSGPQLSKAFFLSILRSTRVWRLDFPDKSIVMWHCPGYFQRKCCIVFWEFYQMPQMILWLPALITFFRGIPSSRRLARLAKSKYW